MFISKKKFKQLQDGHENLVADFLELQDEFAKMRSNGMATIVNKLQKEVLLTEKESEETPLFAYPGMSATLQAMYGIPTPKDATLRGKVEAICEFLGLDFTVTEKKVEPSKVVAKRKVTKKKGLR